MNKWDQNYRQLIYAYLSIALAAAGAHGLANYCYGTEAADFLLFGSLGQLLAIAAVLAAFTWMRIGTSTAGAAGSHRPSSEEQAQRWLRLAAFPRKLAWCYVGAGLAIMLLEALASPPSAAGEPALASSMQRLFDAGSIAALAFAHYGAARLQLRSTLARLHVHQMEPRRFGSAGVALLGVIACGLLYGLPRSVALAAGYGPAVPAAVQAAAWTAAWAAFMLAAYAIAAGWFRSLEQMAKMLHQLAAGARGQLRRRMPIASPYEAGEFLVGFNTLQDRFEAAYARLDHELDLALRVQQQLLVPRRLGWQGWDVRTEVGSLTEAGGGFADIQLAARGRLAIAAGAVIGEGPPAALMMSALVMLFRTRLQQAESAEELLLQLDEALAAIGQGECRAQLGIALVDAEHSTISYALAGAVSLYIEQPGGPGLWAADGAAPLLGARPATGRTGQRCALPGGEEALLSLNGAPSIRILARRRSGGAANG